MTPPRNFLLVALLLIVALPRANADDAKDADPRPPRTDVELVDWLRNMVWNHYFTDAEITAATGLSGSALVEAKREAGVLEAPAKRPADAPLLVLPYPGGRHPRLGFLDGAVRPQRETKVSVFPPWPEGGYAVVDVPEAIFCNLGLLYLAHTHVPTLWTKQGVELEKLEWRTTPAGGWQIKRRLPNGVEFQADVLPVDKGVRMTLRLRNGGNQDLTGLKVQNCVMLGRLKGFEKQTNANKVFQKPYAACRSDDGKRWIITAWEPCERSWGNAPCPCLHSDPRFPDCPRGAERELIGCVVFYEGTDLPAELRRIDQTGWLHKPLK